MDALVNRAVLVDSNFVHLKAYLIHCSTKRREDSVFEPAIIINALLIFSLRCTGE